MKVIEKFISINGEGVRSGELAVFIRFKGCNLNCEYCDTAYANKDEAEYENLSPFDLLFYITAANIQNVTLTGGEPLLQKDMPMLLELLAGYRDINVEIETNGSIDLKPYCKKSRPCFTMDYKLPSSGSEDKMFISNMDLLTKKDCVKFVASSFDDLDRARFIIGKYGLCKKCFVYLSPVFGKITPEKIVEYMKSNNMNNVRLQLQLHKYIWDPKKRGV